MVDKREVMAQLERGVRTAFTSEKYQSYLEAMSKLYNYSVNNTLLIFMQRPDAERVASFTTWKRLKRSVRKGEKGIKIFCPIAHKRTNDKEESGEERVVRGFKIGYVFDISQTDGEPLPTICERLEGEGIDGLVDALKEIAPCRVEERAIESGVAGCYNPNCNEIAVDPTLSPLHKAKTLVHEIAHATLHASREARVKIDRDTREVQAESTAFVVCKALGLDTDGYSFYYIASWSRDKELKALKDSADTILKASREILAQLGKKMPQLKNSVLTA